ncbi:glycosyltransferase family 39 protein [candidate division WWE3 bacterium]|nr:glycosyltransferase family 39 protein [candidate division WWE3 bacterium]
MSRRFDRVAVLAFFIALSIRVIGINHGFPFIFHSDEPAVVRTALSMRFDPNPAHFDWPHLQFYLNYFIYLAFIKVRGLIQILNLQSPLSQLFPILWRDPLVFYGISRAFAALLGALTIVPVYLASKTLFDRKTAFLAAFAFAFIPFHVHASHFALVDVPMTFWVAWALYFCTLIFRHGLLRDYLLAGFFIGLAASTKYNGGLFAATVLVAHFLRSRSNFFDYREFWKLALSGGISVFGFFVGTPYALFDFGTFISSNSPAGALWQFTNVGKVSLIEQISQAMNNLAFKLSDDFGYTIMLGFAAAVFLAFYKRNFKLYLLLAPSLFTIFYVSGFEKTRSHYYMGIYPFVAILAAYVVGIMVEKLAKRKILVYVLLAAFFSIPIYLSWQKVLLLARKDTRLILYGWMSKNVTVLDYLIYSSNSLVPVMEKFSDNRQAKGILKPEGFNGTGYLILGLNYEEYVDFTNEKGKFARVGGRYVKSFEAFPDFRLGPYILVYRIRDG